MILCSCNLLENRKSAELSIRIKLGINSMHNVRYSAMANYIVFYIVINLHENKGLYDKHKIDINISIEVINIYHFYQRMKIIAKRLQITALLKKPCLSIIKIAFEKNLVRYMLRPKNSCKNDASCHENHPHGMKSHAISSFIA